MGGIIGCTIETEGTVQSRILSGDTTDLPSNVCIASVVYMYVLQIFGAVLVVLCSRCVGVELTLSTVGLYNPLMIAL
jgi:hypothetical protein